uniref:Uncharacterized protein n=1 Tax=Coccolithus braarudii TaxID=221442 RepID=A0A7S0QBK1_9EUKA|mmetsp:Transcript_9441/g.20565  ORF Transcript_9441/g.20565 Transcript_9441/m.20565 type:complete len:172 (+) Transcript_9441:2-517(+)
MCLAAEPEPPHIFNPIDVLVEDALGDTVELFTDFIDNLLTTGPGGDLLRLHGASIEMPSAKRKSFYDSRKAVFDSPVGSPISPIELGANTVDFALPPAELAERDDGGFGGGGSYSRKNKPQRCSICKECGHKSRTCKWATGRMPDSSMLYSSTASSPHSSPLRPSSRQKIS